LGKRRKADVELAGPLQDLEEQESGALVPLLAVDLVEGIEPFPRLGRIDIRQLMLELVEVHGSSVLRMGRRERSSSRNQIDLSSRVADRLSR
jgi:hypothetical protein